jgi:hypothetical protein
MSAKNNVFNTFDKGMNTDIHPIKIDNKTLRYARNIDFVTAGTGNQLIAQKRDGNKVKTTITSGFIPVAVSELNNVLYIVSINPTTSQGEIGTYPSPDYASDYLDPDNNSVYVTSEVIINQIDQEVRVPVTSVDGNVEYILLDGITISSKYESTGIPVVPDVDNSVLRVPTDVFDTFPATIPQNTKIKVVGSNSMKDEYAPLNNYHDGGSVFNDSNFNSPFRTRKLYFDPDRFVDMRLQHSYDGSVNIVLTDDLNPVRIINTRFSVDESGKYAELIKRRTGDSTNSYSDDYFNQTELIPKTAYIAKLTFNGIKDGGGLTAGGYRYFFKYIDSDGATTDIIEESRLIELHIGNTPESSYGQDGGKNTNKSIQFTLDSLDSSYFGVKVYYTIAVGEIDAVTEAFALSTPYRISDDGSCVILHSGYEQVEKYNKEELALSYSSIRNCKTLTVANDRLLLANTEETYTTEEIFADKSAELLIDEGTFNIYNDNTGGLGGLTSNRDKSYADTSFAYNNTGYWKGETYELGIVYITDSGLTPVYPIQGIDRLDGNFETGSMPSYTTPKEHDDKEFGVDGINSRGVYRTSSNGTLFNVSGDSIEFKGTKLKVDVSPLLADVTTLPAEYLATNSVGGWKIVYNTLTKEYYLFGTVATTFDSSTPCADLNDTGFNPDGIPIPIRTKRFGAVSIKASGEVFDYGLTIGSDLSKTDGPPIDVKALAHGFFFVRRKRIKDKVMEGMMVPTAAYPVDAKFGARDEFGYPGNWLGCGVSSPKGNSVVLAPTPSICTPFGSDAVYNSDDEEVLSNVLDDEGNPVYVSEAVVIDGSLPKYNGINDNDKEVSIKLSWVGDSQDPLIFEGIATDPAYDETGIPIESFNTASRTINVKLKYFEDGVEYIPSGTFIKSVQKLSELDPVTGVADFIVRAPIKDYNKLGGFALYSPDTDCSPVYNASILKNSTMSLSAHSNNIEGDIQYLSNPDYVNSLLPYTTTIRDTFTLNNSSALPHKAKLDFIGDGFLGTGSKAFTGIVDRSLYVWYRKGLGDPALTFSLIQRMIQGHNEVIPGPLLKFRYDDNPFATAIFKEGIHSKKELEHYKPKDDEDGLRERRPGMAVKYGRYIGVKVEDVDFNSPPFSTLNTGNVSDTSYRSDDAENRNINFWTSVRGCNNPNFVDNSKLGVYTQVFSSNTGQHLDQSSWISRYDGDSDSEYVAISRRFSFDEFDNGLDPVIDLYGGDCYLGLSWKQVWHPLGISEAPQASDFSAYWDDRRNLGMLNYGYAIAIPVQSNYNFHIRVLDRGDAGEYEAFGKERSFIPLREVTTSRGNRQFDTGRYNFGYSDQDTSDNKFFKLSDTAPYYKSLFPNRVYVSEPSNTNEFVNGFTQFRGINFKDYNTELGPIMRIVTFKDSAIAVFRRGIGVIGVSERAAISNEAGGVYIDNSDVLAQKATVLSNVFGTVHPRSVAVTDNFVYGVDANSRKIWRTAGGKPEKISDNRVQTLLGEILDEMEAFVSVNPSDRWMDIFTSYDAHKSDVIFTICAKDRTNYSVGYDRARTLIFNEGEAVNNWVCETDDHRKFSITSNTNRLSVTTVVGKESNIYSYDMRNSFDGNNIFRGERFDAELQFAVVDNPSINKLYENIWIIGDNPLPDSVTYYSDYSNKGFKTEITQTLFPYTNVNFPARYVSGTVTQITGELVSGSNEVILNMLPNVPPPGRTDSLRIGDYITFKLLNGDSYHYTIVGVGPDRIYLDRPAIVSDNEAMLFYGYTNNIRLSDSAIEDGFGKIVCTASNGTNSFDRKVRSHWALVKFVYSGEDQIYINHVATTYTQSFS